MIILKDEINRTPDIFLPTPISLCWALVGAGPIRGATGVGCGGTARRQWGVGCVYGNNTGKTGGRLD